MAQTCTKCSRVNPEGAAYCYHDGAQLAGHSRNGGPVAVGARSFPSPFVFPSGRQCRTFDELALACHEHWPAARDLLREGFFESFLNGLGRADLARAAHQAARLPDRDRGLDQLLGDLPTAVVEPPRLAVAPQEVSLGTLTVGQDTRCELHLENRGMRLLYGSVACDDCDWLALGDPPGSPQKLFQFGSETIIPVQVRGQRLRAGKKPLEGRLAVESNGGATTVVVRAEVPVRPFPDGVLKGALTPRQVAEKAKAAPKEAAPFFEDGAVAAWYKFNGWVYPVRGPAASGLGAVQQFFEALGLTPPPKVDISEREVRLEAAAGASVTHRLEVRSDEKRPVYAHASSSAAWLEIGRPKLNGRHAVIPLVVPTVPDRVGETLTARVTVRSNGNQRFVVPVTLTVGAALDFGTAAPPQPAAEPPKKASAVKPVAAPAPPKPPAAPREPFSPLHLIPVAALFGLLVAVLMVDRFRRDAPPAAVGPDPFDAPYTNLQDREPRLGIEFDGDRRFGIVVRTERDPNDKDRFKRLTYDERGATNNTCVKIDGNAGSLFGYKIHGNWVHKEVKRKHDRVGWNSVFLFDRQDVEVTQSVDLVPGEQTRLLDTVMVRYRVENKSGLDRNVGLRVMLDTYIGANDGVPFAVPASEGRPDRLVASMATFEKSHIPDYVQALEREDLQDPGTVAQLGLKLPDYEPLERMMICRWPGVKNLGWDLDNPEGMRAGDEKPDSCVLLYWPYRPMSAGEVRRMAFTYGLGSVGAGGGDGKLALTAGGSTRPGREFTVTAYVKEPKEGQVVRLVLPEGFALAAGQEAEKRIEGADGNRAAVSWRVRSAGRAGQYVIEAWSGAARATLPFRTRDEGLY